MVLANVMDRGTFSFPRVLFEEPSDPLRLSFVLLIVVGIVGLQLTSGGERC